MKQKETTLKEKIEALTADPFMVQTCIMSGLWGYHPHFFKPEEVRELNTEKGGNTDGKKNKTSTKRSTSGS